MPLQVYILHPGNAKMRLLTHNMLQCPRTKGYPLRLTATEVDQVEVDYRREFVLRMIPRLDWPVLREATAALNVPDLLTSLSDSPPEADASDEALMVVHRAILEYHVVEGQLACAEGPVYSISGGIPNLVGPASSEAVAAMDTTEDDGAKVNED